MNKKQIAAILNDMLTPKDWPDDAMHENGRYSCHCCNCGASFLGHKRRVMCRECSEKPQGTPGS